MLVGLCLCVPLGQVRAGDASARPAGKTARPTVVLMPRYGFGRGLLGFGKAGFWTPLRVRVTHDPRTPSARIRGELVLQPGPFPPAVAYVSPIQLAGRGSKELELYLLPSDLHLGQEGYEFTVAVRDRAGRLRGGQRFFLSPKTALLPEDVELVLTVSERLRLPLPAGVLRKPANPKARLRVRTLCVPVRASDLPRAAEGYAAVTAVLWYDPSLDRLSALQREALEGFLLRGGHLVLAAAPGTVLDRSAWPELPGFFHGPTRIRPRAGGQGVPGGWEGLTHARVEAGAPPDPDFSALEGPLDACRLASAGGRSLAQHRDVPLLVRGAYGRGRVTLLALDLAHRVWSQPLCAHMAARALDLPLLPVHTARLGLRRSQTDEDVQPQYTYYSHSAPSPGQVVGAYLGGANELQPLAFGWVLLFLLAFVALAGPVNSLVLWRKGRLTWTWALFGLTSLAFTIVACGGAYAIKGSRSFIRDVAVLDLGPGQRAARTHYVGLYSVRPRAVSLPAPPGGFVCGLGTLNLGGRYFGPGGLAGQSVVPEPVGSRMVEAGDTVYPEQVDLRQWKMERLLVTDRRTVPWDLTADLTRADDGRLTGVVRNTGQEDLREVLVMSGHGVVRIGTLAAGAVRELQAPAQDWEQRLNASRPRFGATQTALEADDVLKISFPRLYQAWSDLRGRHTGSGNVVSLPPSTDDFVDRLLRALLSKRGVDEMPARLSRWQTLAHLVESRDPQQLDLTRVLCERGVVVLGWGRQGVGLERLARTAAKRTPCTIVRRVVPPEAIRGAESVLQEQTP